MSGNQRSLIGMGIFYTLAGLVAFVLAFTGFDIQDAAAKNTAKKEVREEEIKTPPQPEKKEAQAPVTLSEPDMPEGTAEPENPENTEASKAVEETEATPEEDLSGENNTPEEEPVIYTDEESGAPLTLPAETVEEYYSFTTINREKILHVRTEPYITAEIIARLSPGTTGIVLEVGKDWSKITTSDGSVTGYCSNDYLQFTGITPDEYRSIKGR